MTDPLILDIWQHVEPRFGGVGPAAASLANAVQTASNWRFKQIAYCDDDESLLSDDISRSVRIVKVPGARPIVDRRLRLALSEQISDSTICHVHGVWQAHSLAVQALARRFRKPVIASVHGMLEKWELSHKPLRKRIYSTLFERRALSSSFCLRALSLEEANDYRRFGLGLPIAVVPNGVKPLNRIDPSNFIAKFPQLRDKRVVLYLSRIHEKKGILNLLESWKEIVGEVDNAHLLVAGPEYPEAAAKVRSIITASKVESSVTLCGTISGADKLSALSLAHCFCLPSYSEGQSIAVLEALSLGVPVVITPACNVGGVEESRAGHVTSNNPDALSSSIIQVLSASDADWRRMSLAAEKLARTTFDWSTIGETMLSVYRWMLGGVKPDCVTL